MKQRTWKRILSTILAFAMVLGMVAVEGINVSATEAKVEAIADETAASVEIDRTAMTIEAGDYEPNGGALEGPAGLAIDGNESTIWHTTWKVGPNHDNHWLILTLNQAQTVDGFKYLPRSGGGNGVITEYLIQTSMDKETWSDAATGTWDTKDGWKTVSFTPVEAKYVKLMTLDAVSDQSLKFASAAEVRVTAPAGTQPDPEQPKEDMAVSFDQEYAKAGTALTVTVTGAENVTYVWTVGGKQVSTEASYTPTEADLEKFIQVTVVANGQSASAKMYFSKLPVVYIDTHDGQEITDKENYKDADLRIQGNEEYNSETTTLYDGLTEIRGRGNSTWGMPKKPYKLKLDKKTDLLGMGKNKHWVLLANYSDETLMRNTLAYNFSGSLGMEQMSTVWVSVVFNDSYAGNYQLCEQVRVDETRVDVFDWEGFAEDSAGVIADAEGLDKSTTGDLEDYMNEHMEWITSGKVEFNGTTYTIADYPDIEIPSINGGYLLELDEYYDEVSKFKTATDQPIMFKNPEFVSTNKDMMTYVQTYVQAFENAVRSGEYTADYNGKTTHYSELYDFDALVDYWLITEIFFNEEINKKSTYMYKEIDELMKMGPIWDMDYSSGGEGETYHTEQWATIYYNTKAQAEQWYKYLIKDPYFLMRAQERYWEIRDAEVEDMLQELDDSYELLKESAAAEFNVWHTGQSFKGYVDSLRTWFNNHLTWMDAQMATEDTLKSSLKYSADSSLVLTLADAEGNDLDADTAEQIPADYVLADGEDLTLTVTGISGTANVFVNSRKVASNVANGTEVTIKAADLTAAVGEKDIIEVKASSANFVTVKAYDVPATEPEVCEHSNTTVVGAVDATCTEDGYTGDKVCQDCNDTVEEGKAIPALGHDWPKEWTVVEEATTEKAGKEERACLNECGKKQEQEIPKLEETDDTINVAESDLPKAGAINVTEENVTHDQPFPQYVADSKNFRIPALITLENGELLAAADARWTTTFDSRGLDTIASVSSDNGKTWSYSFPIYFPDSSTTSPDIYDGTTVIDPALVQGPNGVIYCIADVNPSGVTTQAIWPSDGTGYVEIDGVERLVLTDTYVQPSSKSWSTYGDPSDASKYEYYVGDYNSEGYAKVFKRADNSETEWLIDEWFNLYKLGEDGIYTALTQTQVNSDTVIQQNVFYKDSELHVFSTGYILYSKSYDNGRTWVEPTVITTQIKAENETALLVSPGQGMVTSDGDIIIPFYTNTVIGTSEPERASIIWSSDNGETWQRSNNVSGMWSSESEVVEINDGVLRIFFRNGTGAICYADITKENGVWTIGEGVSTGISVTSTCNVTAIRYSEEVNGKIAVIVGCPSNGGSRADGSLFTFLVDENNDMELYYEYEFNKGYYAYSCMSELTNGNIGLLWEDSWGGNYDGTIRYDEVDIDLALGKIKNISIPAGQGYTEENADGNRYNVQEGYDEAIVSVEAEVVNLGNTTLLRDHDGTAVEGSVAESFNAESNSNLNLLDAVFTMQASGEYWQIYNEAKGLYLTNNSGAQEFFEATGRDMIIEKIGDEFQIRKANNTRPVFFHLPGMNFNANSAYTPGELYQLVLLEKQAEISDDDVVPGFKCATEVADGKEYLITYLLGEYVIVLYPTNGTNNQTKVVGTTEYVTKNVLTITGLKKGTTTVAVNDMEYNVTVTSAEIPVEKLTATAEDYEPNGGASEGPADLVLDGNTGSIWHTIWSPAAGAGRDSHWITLEIDGDYLVDGFKYLPRQSGSNGVITEYKIEVSTNGTSWTQVAAGEWANNSTWKIVEFDEPVYAKYVKLSSLNSAGDQSGKAFASAAEIRLTGEPTTAPEPCTHAETEVQNASAATCTEAGYTGDTVCKTCNRTLAAGEKVDALGHDFPESWTVVEAATTEKAGKEERQCTRCDVKEEREIPKLERPTEPPVIDKTEDKAEVEKKTYNSVSLKWNAVDKAESYKVEVYTAGNTETPIATYDDIQATNLTVADLKAKTEYTFKVYAVNELGESAEAMTVEVKTPSKPSSSSSSQTDTTTTAPATGDTAQIFTWIAVAFVMAAGAGVTFFRRRKIK